MYIGVHITGQAMMDVLDAQTTQCHISGDQNSCHAVLNCARACKCRIIEQTRGRFLRIYIAGPYSQYHTCEPHTREPHSCLATLVKRRGAFSSLEVGHKHTTVSIRAYRARASTLRPLVNGSSADSSHGSALGGSKRCNVSLSLSYFQPDSSR